MTRQTISSRLELYNTIMSRGVGWQTISTPAPLYRGPTAKRAAFSSPAKSLVSVKKILTSPASPSRLVYPLSHLSCPPPPPAPYLPRPPVHEGTPFSDNWLGDAVLVRWLNRRSQGLVDLGVRPAPLMRHHNLFRRAARGPSGGTRDVYAVLVQLSVHA